LVEARKNGLLSEIGNAFQEMRENGYWIHEKIVQAALLKSGD
jgi:predicted nucleic acid-binding protein